MYSGIFLTDVTGQPTGPNFKGQYFQELEFLNLEDGIERLSLNVGQELPLYAA
jgi:hypothetical protein